MEMIKSRTIGVEMEGYVDEHPEESLDRAMEKLGCNVGEDGSLSNDDWDYGNLSFGVEVRTSPLNNLNELTAIVDELVNNYGWHVDGSAGTHVHVDISDYTEMDKAKLLRFGKGIERIIYMFVENYRYDNTYCNFLPKAWRKVFWKNSMARSIDWVQADISGDLRSYLAGHASVDIDGKLRNSKYHWINIFDSYYSTAEFRLFHAVRSSEELINQANLAYNIVELVKHSSVEQLEFILKTIYSAPTVEELTDRFFQALNIEEKMEIKCNTAYEYLKNKIENVAVESEPQATELQAI